MTRYVRINPIDDVAVALEDIEKGAKVLGVEAAENIAAGHKIALRDIAEGENIVKYGLPIGHATKAIGAGEWVHTHNARTNLNSTLEYEYSPAAACAAAPLCGSFMGYRRADGSVGIRNEIWIINTVGCVNVASEKIARIANERLAGRVDGVHAFTHPHGCSQMGEDQLNTQRLLAALVKHPNAGGALVMSLGCENNNLEAFRKVLGPVDERRVRFLVAQESDDEIEDGLRLVTEIAAEIERDRRVSLPASKLVVGLKCGGSDGFSGLTANPLLGALCDGLCAAGGTAILTEVPEMFGAETLLMNRCASRDVFDKTVGLINGYKRYFERYGQPVYENPSPGNKRGGISTLEDKSLGCTQKGGLARVTDVLGYAQRAATPGLNLSYGPGNDACAVTGLTAAGAQLILFTTGRGTPLGGPVPTLKVSTNSALAAKKPGWIDFDAGVLARGAEPGDALEALTDLVLSTASGRRARNEENDCREIAIFKDGVTL